MKFLKKPYVGEQVFLSVKEIKKCVCGVQEVMSLLSESSEGLFL
jgi:hypothetical protein